MTNGDAPGSLTVGSFGVTGIPNAYGSVFVVPTDSTVPTTPLIEQVDTTGFATFDTIAVGRYLIAVEGLAYHRATQELEILSGRRDSLCFVMRVVRVPVAFEVR
jgi:hypothetical protein